MGKYLDLADTVIPTTEASQQVIQPGSEASTEPTLLAQYPADELGEPCTVCGSPEKWVWLDGRRLCRPCLIRDGARGGVMTGSGHEKP
jgi:hypothetical protein